MVATTFAAVPWFSRILPSNSRSRPSTGATTNTTIAAANPHGSFSSTLSQ